MDSFDLIEGDGAVPVDPVSGRGALVIEGILWLTPNGADERERRLVLAPRLVSKFDLRGQGMVGNHAAEQVGRNTAHKPCRCAETRHPDGDVEAGTTSHGYGRVAPIRRLDGQEINQGISATQQHRFSFSYWYRRSIRFRASHRRLPDPVFASAHEPAASTGGSPPFATPSARSTTRSPTSRSSRRRSIHGLRPRPLPTWRLQAGPVPGFREVRRSGPSYPP